MHLDLSWISLAALTTTLIACSAEPGYEGDERIEAQSASVSQPSTPPNACDSCITHQCTAEERICDQSEDCLAGITCIQVCGPSETCVKQCVEQYRHVGALYECAQTFCDAECG